MKKMKKALIAAFALIVVCGISAPVIAANLQKTSTRVEQEVTTRNAGLSNAIVKTSAVTPQESADTVPAAEEDILVDIQDTDLVDDAAEAPAEEPAPTEEPAPAEDSTPAEDPAPTEEPAPADIADTEVPDTTAPAGCPYYVDANGDGVCDHCAHGGACGNYVDADGNGVCDYCSHNGSGHCGNYADSNGDGICDNYSGGGNGGYGGHHGGRHHGGHHW
ncbi:MAG: hypothetical protein HFH50_04185 [Lachnospiraceae bacterium]|nr:hypothetical protein [Lachnospiraceae bacterium]